MIYNLRFSIAGLLLVGASRGFRRPENGGHNNLPVHHRYQNVRGRRLDLGRGI